VNLDKNGRIKLMVSMTITFRKRNTRKTWTRDRIF